MNETKHKNGGSIAVKESRARGCLDCIYFKVHNPDDTKYNPDTDITYKELYPDEVYPDSVLFRCDRGMKYSTLTKWLKENLEKPIQGKFRKPHCCVPKPGKV